MTSTSTNQNISIFVKYIIIMRVSSKYRRLFRQNKFVGPVIRVFDSPYRNWYGINDHRSILTVTSGDKIYEAVLRFGCVFVKRRDDRRMQYPLGAVAGG